MTPANVKTLIECSEYSRTDSICPSLPSREMPIGWARSICSFTAPRSQVFFVFSVFFSKVREKPVFFSDSGMRRTLSSALTGTLSPLIVGESPQEPAALCPRVQAAGAFLRKADFPSSAEPREKTTLLPVRAASSRRRTGRNSRRSVRGPASRFHSRPFRRRRRL